MPARLKIRITELEYQKLLELRHNPNLPEKTRKRAEILCLNAKGWTVNQIADWIGICCSKYSQDNNSFVGD
jgi:DNA-binding NarL/FixJ family response regulator